MEINFIKYYSTCNSKNLTTTANKKALLNKLNSSGSYTQIGNLFTLHDGISFKASDIPKLNIDSLYEAYAKRNVMDFGSAKYFKYTNSSGKSLAIFSTPKGSLCTPISENILGYSDYDIETERYLHFWNKLKSGHALMLPPGNSNLPSFGYSDDDIRNYLNNAGISKGFFSVKVGLKQSDFFYSDSKQNPLYTKEEYDLRYYTMTSSDFSYDKSVFNCIDPGTEITISGEKYILKDDFTLDIPYGTDIYDIQIPKHTFTSKVPSNINYTA